MRNAWHPPQQPHLQQKLTPWIKPFFWARLRNKRPYFYPKIRVTIDAFLMYIYRVKRKNLQNWQTENRKLSAIRLLGKISPQTQSHYIETRATKGFWFLWRTVSITTKYCHNVMVIVEGLKTSDKNELLYLYPSDIGCQ